MSRLNLTFAGAVGTVTGSRYLLTRGDTRLLIDCGLFQGVKSLRERNWVSPPFLPGEIDAVVLTHAHIDHSGYLPRLVQGGFKGSVWCTQGTADLLKILLPDAGYLQEEEARRANRYEYTRHRPALPLYTREQAERCLSLLVPVAYHTPFAPMPGVSARFSRAGHIIGSACLSLTTEQRTIVFSGDVGRPTDPIMVPPEPLPPCDYLVLESTYGDRRHPSEDTEEKLASIVRSTAEQGGTLVVPSFAVGRSQHLLHLLARLQQASRIPAIPVYLDSPMAISATELFLRHTQDHRLSRSECEAIGKLAQFAHTPDESKLIDSDQRPKIVISASGMATGGRVLHHLRRFLPDPKSTILIVGYQAAGTRGRALLEGADELKLHGQYVTVRARIAHIESLSAHADYAEMLSWLKTAQLTPRRVFVTHGEPGPADAMRRRLRDTFGWEVSVPALGDVAELAG
jgi:metallo-beta-lactamase family protein